MFLVLNWNFISFKILYRVYFVSIINIITANHYFCGFSTVCPSPRRISNGKCLSKLEN